MNVPAFIDVSEEKQVAELRKYLHECGAPGLDSADTADSPWQTELMTVLGQLKYVWAEGRVESEVEGVLNSIISMILILPEQSAVGQAVDRFTGHLPADAPAVLRLRVLDHLFHGLPANSRLRHTVYLQMVEVAAEGGLLERLITEPKRMRAWLKAWGCTAAECQALWRRLHQALLQGGVFRERATQALVELLATHTDESAAAARDDACSCIAATLGDDDTYIMDHLLLLKPVKFLEGELIHDLLTIFVSGSLNDFLQFELKNREYVTSLGLCEKNCWQKLRLLTLMRLAENQTEISYDTLHAALKLDSDELEEFVIEAVTREAVFCKLDQVNRKVLVYGTTQRTFGRAQWSSLKETLDAWKSNLGIVRQNLDNMALGSEASGASAVTAAS